MLPSMAIRAAEHGSAPIGRCNVIFAVPGQCAIVIPKYAPICRQVVKGTPYSAIGGFRAFTYPVCPCHRIGAKSAVRIPGQTIVRADPSRICPIHINGQYRVSG
jgi:hypothetical protein